MPDGDTDAPLAWSIEAESFRLQSEPDHLDRPCKCCNGEPHIYSYGFRPVDAPKVWWADEMMDLNEWMHHVEGQFRLRPGVRVRITVEEILDA